MESSGDADEVLAERIGQRLTNLAAITDLGIAIPNAQHYIDRTKTLCLILGN